MKAGTKITVLLCLLCLLLPQLTPAQIHLESFEASSNRMEWWQDARFGMFIHWGVYSKAGGEWKGTTNHGEWLQFTAKIPLAEYTEFAKGFNPVDFDADEWVGIAKDAGMKYLVITTKHHDGFALFDSPSNEYNMKDWTEFGRDPIKELADACHREGIRFGVYYSLGRDWHDPDVPTGGEKGRPAGDRSNLIDYPDESIKDFSKYFERKVKPQVRELVTQYGQVDILWFDTPEKISLEQSIELKELIRKHQPNCIINNRIGNGQGDYGTPEQKIPSGKDIKPWETCMTVSERIWGYNKFVGYRDADVLIRNLIDISSKGGNYLLNVGPTGEGIIPEPSVQRLEKMGQWLKVNGEAIYGCGPTPFGPEVGHYTESEGGKKKFVAEWQWRATTKPGKLYIHCFEWPGQLELPCPRGKVLNAYLLADPSVELEVAQDQTGVVLSLPMQAPDKVASVICLELTSFQLEKVIIESEVHSIMDAEWNGAFKHVQYPKQVFDQVFEVEPGEPIQPAIDAVSDAGGGIVFLTAGVHPLSETLVLKSHVSIVGAGRDRTILQQTKEMSGSGFEAQPKPQVTDVLIKDLWLKGIHKNKANGIFMSGRNESRHNRIMIQNLNITDWPTHGLHMKRTDNIIMDRCNLQFNGSGDGLYHNVYFLYNKYILQSDLDMSFPILGKGCKYTSVEHMLAQRCVIRECLGNGIQSDHEQAGYLFFHKYTISGCGRVAMWFPCEHYYDKFNYTEDPKYAPQNVILNRCEIVDNTWGAMWRVVGGKSSVINSTFDNDKIDMGLLKCTIGMEDSTFKTGIQEYTDVEQWPADVKLLW